MVCSRSGVTIHFTDETKVTARNARQDVRALFTSCASFQLCAELFDMGQHPDKQGIDVSTSGALLVETNPGLKPAFFNAGIVRATTIFTKPVAQRLDVNYRFGVRLRQLRRARKLTQVELAEDLGINRSYISDVECGKKGISLAMLEVIALGLKIKLSDLFQDI